MLFRELILNGFDGSTDATDHLIIWVAIEEEFLPKLESLAAMDNAEIDSLDYLFSDNGYIDPAIDLVIIKESDMNHILWDVETKNKLIK